MLERNREWRSSLQECWPGAHLISASLVFFKSRDCAPCVNFSSQYKCLTAAAGTVRLLFVWFGGAFRLLRSLVWRLRRWKLSQLCSCEEKIVDSISCMSYVGYESLKTVLFSVCDVRKDNRIEEVHAIPMLCWLRPIVWKCLIRAETRW